MCIDKELFQKDLKLANEIKKHICSVRSEKCMEWLKKGNIPSHLIPTLILVEDNELTHSQQLKKIHSKEGTRVSLTKDIDILSAVYVPEHVTKLFFYFNEGKVEYLINEEDNERKIEEVLAESKTLPSTRLGIKHLLKECKSAAVGYRHKGEKRAVIDGVEYVRVEAFKPYLPLAALGFTCVHIETYEECDLYLEMTCLNTDTRYEFMKEKHMISFRGDMLFIKGGMIGGLKYESVSLQERYTPGGERYTPLQEKKPNVMNVRKTYKDTNFSIIE